MMNEPIKICFQHGAFLGKSMSCSRSRTNLFLSFRSTNASDEHDLSFSAQDEPDRMLMETQVDLRPEIATPVWYGVSQRIRSQVEEVRTRLAQLYKLQAKHVLPAFTNRSHEERVITELTESVSAQLARLTQECAQVGILTQKSTAGAQISPESKRILLLLGANAETAHLAQVEELSRTFQHEQDSYMKQLSSTYANQKHHGPLFSIEDEEQNASSPSNMLQQSMSSGEAYLNPLDVANAREIDQIASSVNTLSALLKEINNIVIDQGSLMDRIDYNVEQMEQSVRGSVTQLARARRTQSRKGKLMVLYLLVLLSLAAFLILVYKAK